MTDVFNKEEKVLTGIDGRSLTQCLGYRNRHQLAEKFVRLLLFRFQLDCHALEILRCLFETFAATRALICFYPSVFSKQT